jgi:integrase
MLALRFGDIDRKRRLITLRGPTTKSRRTRVVPFGTARLMAVLEWLQLDGTGGRKGDDVSVFSNELGEPLKTFKKAWVVAVRGVRRLEHGDARVVDRHSADMPARSNTGRVRSA